MKRNAVITHWLADGELFRHGDWLANGVWAIREKLCRHYGQTIASGRPNAIEEMLVGGIPYGAQVLLDPTEWVKDFHNEPRTHPLRFLVGREDREETRFIQEEFLRFVVVPLSGTLWTRAEGERNPIVVTLNDDNDMPTRPDTIEDIVALIMPCIRQRRPDEWD